MNRWRTADQETADDVYRERSPGQGAAHGDPVRPVRREKPRHGTRTAADPDWCPRHMRVPMDAYRDPDTIKVIHDRNRITPLFERT